MIISLYSTAFEDNLPYISPSLRFSNLFPRVDRRVGEIAITFGVAVTFAYFGVRDVCEMSTIIKLPAARDQQASEPGNFIIRAEIPNLSDIEVSRLGFSRKITKSGFRDEKKKKKKI